MEASQYQDNAFVTLTYDPSLLPTLANGSPTLVPLHLRNFLKRLRHHQQIKLRYFAVGEYGSETWRPHYHLGIFNFPNCLRGETRKSLSGRCLWSGCCATCELVGNAWHCEYSGGDIEVRALAAEKCGYLAGYVTKKMTGKEDARLAGRHPEFSRQSRRPGVGFPGVVALAKTITQHVDPRELVDVPQFVNQGKNNPLPLGRYIRNKLRLALHLPEGAPDEVLRQAWFEQVLPVLEMAKANNESPSLRQAFAAVNAAYEAKLRAKMGLERKGKI